MTILLKTLFGIPPTAQPVSQSLRGELIARRDSTVAPLGSIWRLSVALSILLPGCSGLLFCQIPGEQAGQSLQPGSASRGTELFAGTTRFVNGGPPCAACHNAAGLPFPGGGSMGPDLTRISAKLGPLGIDPTLRTLFFPTMTSIYDAHRLTPDERADLKAFFLAESSGPATRSAIPGILLLAFGGLVILLAVTGFVGRDRLKSVRKRLLERATGTGGKHP